MQNIDVLPFLGFLFLSVSLTIRILFLKSKGINVSTNPEKIKNNKFLLYPVFGLIFSIWLLENIKSAFYISYSILPELFTNWLIENIIFKVSGVVIILISLILWTITLIHFKTSLRFGLNENNQGKLITSGIYSRSRNPFFLSLDLYFLGVALILPSLFFISFTVLAVISIHFFILKEEKFLQKVYGEKYEKYQNKVHRYC